MTAEGAWTEQPVGEVACVTNTTAAIHWLTPGGRWILPVMSRCRPLMRAGSMHGPPGLGDTHLQDKTLHAAHALLVLRRVWRLRFGGTCHSAKGKRPSRRHGDPRTVSRFAGHAPPRAADHPACSVTRRLARGGGRLPCVRLAARLIQAGKRQSAAARRDLAEKSEPQNRSI